MSYHDLRLAYLHRHSYKFVERRLTNVRDYYLFVCDDCVKHGIAGKRLIEIETFWGVVSD